MVKKIKAKKKEKPIPIIYDFLCPECEREIRVSDEIFKKNSIASFTHYIIEMDAEGNPILDDKFNEIVLCNVELELELEEVV